MRPGKACVQCRISKKRCDQTGSSACRHCLQKNVPCSALSRQYDATSPQPAVVLPSPSDQTVVQLVELYFKFIHNKPHSIFHEPTFKASVLDGTASKSTVLSMSALSARFSKDAEIRSRGTLYFTEAEQAVKDDFGNICIETIQAYILMGNVCMGISDSNSASLYYVLANRMAHILRIHVPDEADDGATKETKIRIWWSCFIIDTWLSGGTNSSRQFQLQSRPRVPMDETTFFNMKRGEADVTARNWRPGLWGYMVELVEIYSQVQDLHKLLADSAEWDEDSIEESVRVLDIKLIDFERSLEPRMRYSLDNLMEHIKIGLGRTFIAFHLGYYHYCTLLFYLYLDQRRPFTRNGKNYANRCKLSATAVCDILKASRKYQGAEALYNIVGHVTIVSSSVLLHTYLFGEVDNLTDIKSRLESNLESLVLLRGYWLSVELMINRLVIFQNNCLRSLTKNTYRFDRWMVGFLLEHALTLEEKQEAADQSMPDQWTRSEMNTGTPNVQLERSRVTHDIILDIQNSGQDRQG